MLYAFIGLGIAAVVILAILLFLRRRRQRNAGPISIVLLRSSPRRFSEADLRAIFRRIHKHDPQIQKLSPDHTTDAFLMMGDGLPPLAVVDSRRQYADKPDLEQTAAHHDHPTLRNAIVNHTAWISIDAMGVNASVNREDRALIYTLLAPLAAEFLDDKCMLLYLPAEDRVAEPGENAERLLREGRVAELFGDDELHSPLIHVEKDDAAINNAIKEAQTRLPEFCSAFDRLGEDSEALFKARFKTSDPEGDGHEYIWCRATSLAAAGFTGVVLNHAVDPAVPTKDSTVTVKLDDIVDWTYVDERQKPHGMFVDRILMSRQR